MRAIAKESFDKIVGLVLKTNEEENAFLYEVYTNSLMAIEALSKNSIISSENGLNQSELIFYIVGEYIYSKQIRNEEEMNEFIHNENIIASMASVVTDKYISLGVFNYQERNLANKFLPPTSSMNLYLNFMLNILKNYPKNDPKTTLVADLLMKSVSIARCISSLLVDGYETEAFASWRTLHECECTLILIAKYEKDILDVYLKHMRYGLIYKKGHSDTEEENNTFLQMKEEMQNYGLKSKDMKKYIEYGWMYSIPGFKEDETFKLNFRDGLEKLAGLSVYNDRYEISSEIIHSTPMLIYSSKEYFYFLTIISLYESFFRLEQVFETLFFKRVSDEIKNHYLSLKKVYYVQLQNILKRELVSFKKWQENALRNK